MADIDALVARIAELEARVTALNTPVAAAQEANANSMRLARDAYLTLANAKKVGVNERLGAISSADDIAGAPLGQEDVLKDRIGRGLGLRYNGDPDGWKTAEMGSLRVGDFSIGGGGNPDTGSTPPLDWCTMVTFNSRPDHAITLAASNGGDPRYYISSRHDMGGGNYKQWALLYNNRNTTVDGSGAIKVASPIVRLISRNDAEGMNSGFLDGFTLCGCGAANEEALGVTCTRVGVGVYRVTGALGWNTDGIWHISTPKDGNGQELLWVNATEEADGSITVRTYHRTHPEAPEFARNHIEGVAEAAAIDITPGRWIDLRLEMPEKPHTPSPTPIK